MVLVLSFPVFGSNFTDNLLVSILR